MRTVGLRMICRRLSIRRWGRGCRRWRFVDNKQRDGAGGRGYLGPFNQDHGGYPSVLWISVCDVVSGFHVENMARSALHMRNCACTGHHQPCAPSSALRQTRAPPSQLRKADWWENASPLAAGRKPGTRRSYTPESALCRPHSAAPLPNRSGVPRHR